METIDLGRRPRLVQDPAIVNGSFTLSPTERATSNVDLSAALRVAWSILTARYCDSDQIILMSHRLSINGSISSHADSYMGGTIVDRGSLAFGWDTTVSELLQATQICFDLLRHSRSLDDDGYWKRLLNRMQVLASAFGAGKFREWFRAPDSPLTSKLTDTYTAAFKYGSSSGKAILVFNHDDANSSKNDELGSQEWLTPENQCSIIVQSRVVGNELAAQVQCDPDLFDVPQLNRVMRQLDSILSEICNPKHSQFKANMIRTICQQDLADIWNWNSLVPKANVECVHELIHSMAASQPDSLAVHAWDGRLTYAELDAESDKLAQNLASLGVRKGTVVALLSEKSARVPLMMLALLKAGAVSVLLSEDLPTERLRYICDHSQPMFAITTQSQKYQLDGIALAHTVDELLSIRADDPVPCTTSKVYHQDLAFIVFTSGSTGHPKGIMWSHEGLCINTEKSGKAFNIGLHTRNFQFSSYMFDVAILETLTVLMYGGCVCIPSEDDRLNNAAATISRFEANWICITPSTSEGISPDETPTLKTVVFGGESLKLEQASRWSKGANVINCYGPAEGSFATYCRVVPGHWKTGFIGTSTTGVCWIVDSADSNRLVPIGAIGELCLEGPLIAKGYLSDINKTTESFLEDPDWLISGPNGGDGRRGRVYRTGDLVRYDPEGRLVYVCRKDTQVKIRGQRVELEEVEHQLRRHFTHPSITRIVAEVVTPQLTNCATLVAFVHVNSPYAANMTIELHDTSKLQLPTYMIPTLFIPIYDLPITKTGKVDRRMLREIGRLLSWEELNRSPKQNRPDNDVDRKLASLWAQVLQLDSNTIFADDNFLHIGGDSVKLISLIPLISRTFDIQISVQDVIRHKSLSELGEHILTLSEGPPNAEKSVADDLEVEGRIWEVESLLQSMPLARSRNHVSISTTPQRVFLTGATGYLGTALLHKLLGGAENSVVVVLVRGHSIADATRRIIGAATKAGWWQECFRARVEVWLGDLGKCRLGLDEEYWEQLSGNTRTSKDIDAIVHNGASVNWCTRYSDLYAVNVKSTYQLLKVSAMSLSLKRLIFVSTGPEDDDTESEEKIRSYLRLQLKDSNGYWQSKLVAEKVMSLAVLRNRVPKDRIRIIKPGFIIGNTHMNTPNIDDFIWRLVAGAVSIETFPEQDHDSWIYVSTCGSLVDTIVEGLHDSILERPMRSIRHGIRLSRFWAAVNTSLPTPLVQIPFASWYQDLEHRCSEMIGHPALPILHEIRPDGLGLGTVPAEGLSSDILSTEKELEAAVQSNVATLVELKYFQDHGAEAASAAFRRSEHRP